MTDAAKDQIISGLREARQREEDKARRLAAVLRSPKLEKLIKHIEKTERRANGRAWELMNLWLDDRDQALSQAGFFQP